jgi:hypothetical protein
VSPSSALVPLGGEQAFSAAVTGLQDASLVWSVNGIPGGNPSIGTIQPRAGGAVYTASAVPSPDSVTVAATSQTNSSVSSQATIAVFYPDDAAQSQTFPIRLGTSGGNATDLTTSGPRTTCCSGTLGSLVSRDGTFFILSNNHVLDKSGHGSPGDPICQPGLTDNRCAAGAIVASLAQAAPLMTSNVDAALALVAPGAVDLSGAILDLGAAGPTGIVPGPPSAILADPGAVLAAGTRVAKTGRSTGLTCAMPAAISADVQVDYSTSCGGPTEFTVTFHNQILISGAGFSESGDSGSLVVTVDAARPLGLLYAGSSTTTVAHPIADVLNALQNPSTNEVPRIVGGADHPVSCAAMADLSGTPPAITSMATLSAEELARVSDVRDRFGKQLLEDPAVAAVGVGTSADHPSEGALLVTVRSRPSVSIPRTIGGVRTKILWAAGAGNAPAVRTDALEQSIRIKAAHAAELLRRRGVLGAGVGLSKDAPGETAIVVIVEAGSGFAGIEPEMEGVRTQVLEGERLRAFGWGSADGRSPKGCCGQR